MPWQQRGPAAPWTLFKSIARRLRQVTLPLHWALLGHSCMTDQSESCKGSQMTQGLKHLSYKDRLRELGLFRPEKRRLRDQSNQCALNTWPSTCPSQEIDSSQYHHQYHLDNLLQTHYVGTVNQEPPQPKC